MQRLRDHARSIPAQRVLTTARWPAGVVLTAWNYTWRITPMHRRERAGSRAQDAPPPLPAGVERAGIQMLEDGAGPLLRRRYRARIRGSRLGAEALVARLSADPDAVAPGGLARFLKTRGEEGRMAVGDEWLVRMPGPWNGPIRVVEVTPASFRFATLEGHLEAGQIEWRAAGDGDDLLFGIESWARSGDRLSDLMHNRLRMAKEVQLHMWTSVVERVAALAGGRLGAGIDIETRRVEWAHDAVGEDEHAEDDDRVAGAEDVGERPAGGDGEDVAEERQASVGDDR
jgi:hypothetical protein